MSATDVTIKAGTTSKIIEVMLRDSTTGQGKTGLAFGDVTASYVREGGTRVAITLASVLPGSSYTSGGWSELDATNTPGLYQLHIPDAALASGVAAVTLFLKEAGTIDKAIRIVLITVDLRPSSGHFESDVQTVAGEPLTADEIKGRKRTLTLS